MGGAHCDITIQHSSMIDELTGSIYLTYYEKEKINQNLILVK